MVDSVLFIGTIVVAVTEAIRLSVPKVSGPVTIGVAVLVGLLVAVVDTKVGIADISIAQGVLIGLSAAGVTAIAKKV